MRSQTTQLRKVVPCKVHYINGKKHITITIQNTKSEDWVDKQEVLLFLRITSRTLQTMRTQKQVPWSKIGRRIMYYMPGIVAILEQNLRY